MKDRPIVKMMMQNSAHILSSMKQTHSSVLKMRNPENSSRRSSNSGTRASLSSNGHPDQLHALSAADHPQEWNYWHGAFPPRVRIGEPHSGCSDVSSEPRKICTDPEYDIPTSDCLATTGPSMFTESKKYIGPRLPPRTTVQGHGRNKEIVVLHIEQSDEYRGMLPKSSNKSILEFDSRHVTRADLPFATIGVFHIHPSISHGAAREDLQNEIMPLVTLYQCDAITGDANKSANSYSRLQHVFNPANGLMKILMKAYQRLWNETENLPLVDRMEYAMETSCTLKSIVLLEGWIRV